MKPTGRDLASARDEFRHLLGTATREAEWQKFFSLHPYVLSMSLPLRLEPSDIVPLGRPGKAEPDFIFFPRRASPVPYYGVIELKRPSSQLVTITRSNVAVLSRDAETAIQQASVYSSEIARYAPIVDSSTPVFLGNRAHLFVVMGTSREISDRLANDVYREMISRRLPPNLQLMPFDTLLAHFEAALPPRVYILTPGVDPVQDREQLIRRVNAAWEILYGVAVRLGQRNAEVYSRSSHGYRPEWLVRTWLPEHFGNIDGLRAAIEKGLPDSALEELSALVDALEAAIPEARKRDST